MFGNKDKSAKCCPCDNPWFYTCEMLCRIPSTTSAVGIQHSSVPALPQQKLLYENIKHLTSSFFVSLELISQCTHKDYLPTGVVI